MSGATAAPVTLNGTGFNTSSTVQINGTSEPATYVSPTQITWTPTSSNLGAAGSLSVAIANPTPGGGISSGLSFTVNNRVPVLAAVNPASVMAGSGALTLDIVGTGFSSGSVVNLNGSALTTFINATELKASVPASALAASSANEITALNPSPGGGVSNPTTFNVNSPTPVLTGVSPRNVVTGTQATVTLTGRGFEANSIVQWNGVAHAHTVVNNSTLQVVLTAADLANNG